MDNKIYNISVQYDTNNPIVSWEIYPGAIKYNLLRGTTIDNLEIFKSGLEVSQIRDETVAVSSTKKENRTTIYYDVEAVLLDNSTVRYNNPTFYTPKIDYPYKGVIEEIKRRHRIMLSIGAEECTIYIKKTFGMQCPKCWNKFAGNTEAAAPLCSTCFNTGFSGGYHKFITKLMIRDAPDSYIETPFGIKKESVGKQGWLSSYPLIHSGDLIVEPNGDRWAVDTAKIKEFKNIVTLQVANIVFLESSHPFYQINL